MNSINYLSGGFHFSVDDVFNSLIEITDKKISLKKHHFFKILYKLWKKYKIRTGLHVFYQGKIEGKLRTLKDVKILKKEIKEGWIYFGAHGLDIDTPPYTQKPNAQKKVLNNIYKEIYRFAGKKFLCKRIRLHHYSESYEISNFLKKKKISALFSTDRKVGAHKLPKELAGQLIKDGTLVYNKLQFIRTDYRIEFLTKKKLSKIIKNFFRTIKNKKFIIIYSHESEFNKKKIQNTLNKIMKIFTIKFKLENIHP
jgi:hypothetical protein